MRSPLEEIPGVGKRTAAVMEGLGIREAADLRGQDPEVLYLRECAMKGRREDRCALYVWRCAVYCAAHPEAPPERKKWWNYQDNSPFLREQEENEENER